MKWFSFSAVWKEISKIRWPKKGDLLVNSAQVIIFTGYFVAFFAVCLAVISALLRAIGVI